MSRLNKDQIQKDLNEMFGATGGIDYEGASSNRNKQGSIY
jgi:hypothetical protein